MKGRRNMKTTGPAFEKRVSDLRGCGLSDCEIAKFLGANFGRVARVQTSLRKRIVSVPLVKNVWMMRGDPIVDRT